MKLRPQRTNWPITAPNIIVIKFTMTAMVGKPPSHINMPRPAAYNVRAGIAPIRGAAPQLAGVQRWYALARYIADKILAFVPNTPTPVVVATG